MQKFPYIGVTDFILHEQVTQALACIPETCLRRLHVGHMMSYKTFHGIPTETGWEKIWLRGQELRSVFKSHPQVFNVLHWADFAHPYLTTSDDLIAACHEAGHGLDGLQLDMMWPNRQLIIDVKRELPHLEIILQVGKTALLNMESRQETLMDQMEHYKSYVDYFLIDWGMGKGAPMDVDKVMKYVADASMVVPQTSLGVAGGIGPTTYQSLSGIFALYHYLSCDAQGQMRSSGKATDPIEMDRVCQYINGVVSLLKKHV